MNNGQENSDARTEVAGAPPDLLDPCLLPTGTRVGRYRIVSVIHSSRMSVVYRAERDEEGQPHQSVALKMPLGGRLIHPDALALFKQEMETAAALDHSAVVPVLDFGEHGGIPYYVMQFIEGRSLDDHIRREKPAISDRVELFARICAAVQSLHSVGLVHRDIKPQNIMVDKYGDIRLLDFGLAKAFQRIDATDTDIGVAGTYQYMAPEQARGNAAGAAADVYSLGVVLYLLLTDLLPYTVKGGQKDAARAITDAIIEPPSSRNTELTGRYDSLTMMCLEKRPSRRPQTAGEAGRALQALLSGRTRDVALPGHANAGRRLALAALLLAAGAGLWYMHRRLNPSTPGAVATPAAITTAAAPPVETPVVTTTVPAEVPAPPPTTTTPTGRQPDRPEVHVTTIDRPTTTTTQPVPGEATASIRIYPEQYVLDALRKPTNRPAGQGVPKGLWGVHDEAITTLSRDPEYRRHGAILLRARAESTLIWQVGSSSPHETEMLRGAACLLIPAGRPCLLTWNAGGQKKTIRITLAKGEIIYREL